MYSRRHSLCCIGRPRNRLSGTSAIRRFNSPATFGHLGCERLSPDGLSSLSAHFAPVRRSDLPALPRSTCANRPTPPARRLHYSIVSRPRVPGSRMKRFYHCWRAVSNVLRPVIVCISRRLTSGSTDSCGRTENVSAHFQSSIIGPTDN